MIFSMCKAKKVQFIVNQKNRDPLLGVGCWVMGGGVGCWVLGAGCWMVGLGDG